MAARHLRRWMTGTTDCTVYLDNGGTTTAAAAEAAATPAWTFAWPGKTAWAEGTETSGRTAMATATFPAERPVPQPLPLRPRTRTTEARRPCLGRRPRSCCCPRPVACDGA